MKLSFFVCMCMAAALLAPLAHARSLVSVPVDVDTPEKWVALHNTWRATVGSPPLTWNETLAQIAKDYSQERSKDCELVHSTLPYGENIYWAQGVGLLDAASAVKAWAEEELPFYNYADNSCAPDQMCGHYTQIVWKNTQQVGCGIVPCTDAEDKVFITCEYYPAGNVVGQKPY